MQSGAGHRSHRDPFRFPAGIPVGRASYALAMLAALCHCRSAPPRTLIIDAGRLVDGTSAAARSNIRITVRDGTITGVDPYVAGENSPPAPVSDDAFYIDAQKMTVMPGIVNALTSYPSLRLCTRAPSGPFSSSAATQLAGDALGHDASGHTLGDLTNRLHRLMTRGVTTVGIGFGAARDVTALREYVGTARHRGPRLFVSGLAIMPPAEESGISDSDYATSSVRVDGAKQARLLVRAQAASGVDFIVVHLVGEPSVQLRGEEVGCSAVAEARRQDLRVMARIVWARETDTGRRSTTTDVATGVRAAHGGPGATQGRAAAVESISATGTASEFEAKGSPSEPQGLVSAVALARRWLGGCPPDVLSVALTPPGSSELDCPRDWNALPGATRAAGRENPEQGPSSAEDPDTLSLHPRSGSPSPSRRGRPALGESMQAWVDSTAGGAASLGLQDALGRVAVGYRADLIAVRGNPTRDLGLLRDVQWVIIDGVVQKGGDPPWAASWLLRWQRWISSLGGAQ